MRLESMLDRIPRAFKNKYAISFALLLLVFGTSYQNCGTTNPIKQSSNSSTESKFVLKEGQKESDRTVLVGTIKILVVDYFKLNRSENIYILKTTEGKSIELKNVKTELKSNDIVEVRGSLLESKNANVKFDVADVQIIQRPTTPRKVILRKVEKTFRKGDKDGSGSGQKSAQVQPQLPNVSEVRTLAVILVNFSDNPVQPITMQDLLHQTFSMDTQQYGATNGFYLQNTFEKMIFQGVLDPLNGDGFGWYTIPASAESCDDMGIYSFGDYVREQVLPLAAADGLVEDNYDHIVISFPSTDCGEGMGGWAEGEGRYSYINTATYSGTVVHEIGHNLGLMHAGRLDCTDSNSNPVVISDTCEPVTYGDPFSIMGGAFRDFNNVEKYDLGIFLPEQIKEVLPDQMTVGSSQFVNLAPSEKNANAVQLIKIVTGQFMGDYTIEYRETYGVYDNFPAGSPVTQGLLIRKGYMLLDMHPQGDSNIQDQALNIGETFEIPGTGIKITPQYPKQNYLNPVNRLRVKIQKTEYECSGSNPSISIPDAPIDQRVIHPGGYLDLPAVITNNNPSGCINHANYQLLSTIQNPGYSIQWLQGQDITIPAGQSASVMVRLLNVAPSSYGMNTASFLKVVDVDDPQSFYDTTTVQFDFIPATCTRNNPVVEPLTPTVTSNFPVTTTYAITNMDSTTCPIRIFVAKKNENLGESWIQLSQELTVIPVSSGLTVDQSLTWIESASEAVSGTVYDLPAVLMNQLHEDLVDFNMQIATP
jgi:hypothetical protein